MSKTTLRVAATYIGAVMGAGFASGQEILQFFTIYRAKGILGIVAAGILFALFGFWSLSLIKRYHINTYQDMFALLLGKRLGKLCEVIVTIFLFAGLVIMLAGSGAVFEEYFGLSPTFGVLLTSLAVLIALASRGEGVMWINTVLIPLKLVICLSVSLAVMTMSVSPQGASISPPVPDRHWFASALLYVSFNMTFAMVVLSSLGHDLKGNLLGGILGGVGLGLFALAIGSALWRLYPEVSEYQVPMVHIALQVSPMIGVLYLLVLWFAMITAAVGNAFSFVKRITQLSDLPYLVVCLVSVATAFPLAHLRFSDLVAVVYPAFGYIGLLLLGPLAYLALKHKLS